MSDRKSSIGGSNSRYIQAPVTRPKAGYVADPSGRVPEQRRTQPQQRDPYNLRAAFDRLAKLLRRDREQGQQAGLPPRGYYLNILV